MSPEHIRIVSRRRFLQYLAASPLFAQVLLLAEGKRWSDPMDWAPRDLDKLITNPRQARDVFDFELVMQKNVPPAHFGYMATGVDDEVTLRANREGFRQIPAAPAAARRCQQSRYDDRDPRHDIRQPDRHCPHGQ